MPVSVIPDIPRFAREVAKELDEGDDKISVLERALFNARQEGRELAKSDDSGHLADKQRQAYKTARAKLYDRIDMLEHKLEAVRDVLINQELNHQAKVIVALGIINETLLRAMRR